MGWFEAIATIGIWTAIGLLAYIYIGYALTLMLLPARPLRRERFLVRPSVTVIIAAHNEVRHIAATVTNKLDQSYPGDLLNVIVVSDGSSDGTDAAVETLRSNRVTLLRQNPRQGKTMALNMAMSIARGDIVVFSDGNSVYARDAVEELIATFEDATVGYVTGRLVYRDPGGAAVGAGSGLYMQYENWLRRLETRVGSIVGVNGGIDAVRRSQYEPMRADHLPDFVLPLRVAAKGQRVVVCETAVACEDALSNQHDEYRMRVRVSLRGLHTLAEMRGLLRPQQGLFAFELLVHKVFRYLVVLPLVGAFLCNLLLIRRPEYAWLFTIQALAYTLALVGYLSGGRIRWKPVFVPFYFCLINFAAAAAVLRFLKGERQVVWTPRKGA